MTDLEMTLASGALAVLAVAGSLGFIAGWCARAVKRDRVLTEARRQLAERTEAVRDLSDLMAWLVRETLPFLPQATADGIQRHLYHHGKAEPRPRPGNGRTPTAGTTGADLLAPDAEPATHLRGGRHAAR